MARAGHWYRVGTVMVFLGVGLLAWALIIWSLL